ncbi:uncharacterized protein LOC5516490 [Nematostella vectensis]|uniref:uncharacterized protein LOC5516490 n=1 Tax=Nematostella vectensis TaxID=45351 RepID=UPI002076F781|nr:uncharacterized protein LOC5516490 [Nematostella vectensis]
MQTHVCSVPRDICTILLLFLLACIKSSCDAHALYRWDSHNERTNIENSDASKLDRPRTFDTDDFTDKQMSLSAGEYWGSTDQNGVYRRDGIPWRDKNTEDYSLPPRSKKQDILEEYDDNGNQDSVISYFGSHEIKSDETGSPKSGVPLFGNHVKEGEVDQKAMESLEHLKVVQDADREVTDMVNSVIDTDANMAGMLNAGGTGGALGGIPVDSTGKGFLEKNEDKDMDVTFDESEAGSSSQLDQPRRGNEDTLGKVEVIDNGNDEAMKGSLVSQSDQPRLEDEAKQDKVDHIDGGVKSLALKAGSLTTGTKQAADTFFDNEVGPNSTSQTILRIGKPGNVINKTSVAKHDSGDKTLGMRIDEQMAELLKNFAERENGTNDSTSVTDSPRSSTTDVDKAHGHNDSMNPTTPLVSGSPTDVDKAHGHNDSMNPTTPLVSGSPIIPTPKSNENALSAVNILASSGISMETGSSDETSMTTGSSDRPSITTGSSDVTSAITGSSDVTSAITGSSGQVINFNEVGNVENDNLPTYKESKPLDWDLQNNKQLASDGNHGMSGSYGNANPMGDNVIGSSGAVIPSGVVDVNPIVDAPSKEERNETIDIISSTITQPGGQSDTNPIRAASSQHTKITVSEDLDNNNVTIPFSEESGDKVQEDLKKMTSNFLTVHPSSLPVLMEYFKNETALQKQLQNKLRTVSSDGSARATKKSFGEEVPGDPPKVTQRNSSNGENNKKEAMKQFVLRLLKMFSMVKSRLATLAKKQGRDSKKSYASETPTRKATVEINANFDNVADLLRKINVSEIFQEETAPERDMDVMALDSGGKNGTQLENGNVSSIGIIGKPTGSEAMKTKSNAGPLDSNAMKTESNADQLDSNAMKTESNAGPLDSNAMKTKSNASPLDSNAMKTESGK